jgi:hypothetical protein
MTLGKSVAALTRLFDQKSEIGALGVASAEFSAWHNAVLQALAESVGESDPLYKEFEAINFQSAPQLRERAKRTARRVISLDQNVARITPAPSFDRAEARYFRQAIERASEILLAARSTISKPRR